jgi:hypothetical protein
MFGLCSLLPKVLGVKTSMCCVDLQSIWSQTFGQDAKRRHLSEKTKNAFACEFNQEKDNKSFFFALLLCPTKLSSMLSDYFTSEKIKIIF